MKKSSTLAHSILISVVSLGTAAWSSAQTAATAVPGLPYTSGQTPGSQVPLHWQLARGPMPGEPLDHFATDRTTPDNRSDTSGDRSITEVTPAAPVFTTDATPVAPPATTDVTPAAPAATTDKSYTPEAATTERNIIPAEGSMTMAGQPQKMNKASELIGMEVKNQQGEKLGKIRDVVIDLKSGRAAYAVIGVSEGTFGLREKLHAVPLNAFQASATGDSLTLYTDKDKLARAQGFDKNSWPSVSNPSWGAEPFWQDPAGQNIDVNQLDQNKINNQEPEPGTPTDTERESNKPARSITPSAQGDRGTAPSGLDQGTTPR